MSISTSSILQPSVSAHKAVKIVVLSQRLDERSIQQIVGLSSAPAVELHIIELGTLQNTRSMQGRVLRRLHLSNRSASNLPLAESREENLLWSMCAPGSILDRVVRYCARIDAKLVVMLESAGSDARRWWRKTFAEQLASHFPVLSIPQDANWEQLIASGRRLRWIVP